MACTAAARVPKSSELPPVIARLCSITYLPCTLNMVTVELSYGCKREENKGIFGPEFTTLTVDQIPVMATL